MSDLDELAALVPPPPAPPPAVDWAAVHGELGAELPADYRGLVERYGAGNLGGLRVMVPVHPNRYVDLLRQIGPQRWALQYLIDEGEEMPYSPQDLLPWGLDESGNVVWWLMDDDWPVVSNEARGEEWLRFDGGAVAFLVAMLSGRLESDFLVIGGDAFEPVPYEPETGP